jgi:hypothetical protein
MAKQMIQTLSEKEKNELLGLSGKQPYKMQGHQWVFIGKQVCKHCGLVALRNRATDWCVEKGCFSENHPQYESAMKRLTKRNF